MNRSLSSLVGAVFTLLMSAALAQTPKPILLHAFDNDAEGWSSIGTNTRITVAQASFNGKGCLKFEYDIKKGQMSGCVYQPAEQSLARAKTFRFWINTDYPTTFALVLQEKDGARYVSPFTTPKNKWQKVECSTTDFVVMEGLGSPADANNHLDADQIVSIAFIDVTQFIAMSGSDDIAKLLGTQMGAHTMLLDDFTVTDELLLPDVVVSPTEVRLDTFARPQAAWMCLGGALVTRIDGKTLPERGIQCEYKQAPARVAGFIRPIGHGNMKAMGRVALSVSSLNATTLIMQLEEAGGGKFNTTVEIPAGGAMKAATLDLDAMTPADESTVKDRKVKPELVTQLTILDAFGMMGLQTEQDNVLRIYDVRALPAK